MICLLLHYRTSALLSLDVDQAVLPNHFTSYKEPQVVLQSLVELAKQMQKVNNSNPHLFTFDHRGSMIKVHVYESKQKQVVYQTHPSIL